MTNQERAFRASLARRLKEVRESKGMAQYDLSKATGIAQPTISQYEAGNIALDLYTLVRLCEGLGCSLDYLLGLDVDFDTDNPKGQLLQAFSKMSLDEQKMFASMLEWMVKDK